MKRFESKYRQMWGMAAGLAAVLAAMLLLGKCSHQPRAPFAQSFVKAGGDTLDIAIELNPSIYSVAGDSASGKDYAILVEISQRHGVPMKFHPFVPLKHALDGLEAGHYDLVAASMPMTSDLKQRFLMTDPVYLDREILVQRLDTAGQAPVASVIQLGGDTVWIPSDSPIADRIANLGAEIGDTIYVKSDPGYTAEHLFMLVAAGVISKAVINENVAQSMAKEYPNVDVSTPVSFNQFQSWAVSKSNPALLDSINSWLAQLPRKSKH